MQTKPVLLKGTTLMCRSASIARLAAEGNAKRRVPYHGQGLGRGCLRGTGSISASAICTKPLARQTPRVRYFRHYGLPQPPESLFAFRL